MIATHRINSVIAGKDVLAYAVSSKIVGYFIIRIFIWLFCNDTICNIKLFSRLRIVRNGDNNQEFNLIWWSSLDTDTMEQWQVILGYRL
uniref:MAM domain-containing protein n=1 Tax=Heterorhabditis bacteriophora TaxID=37862 RepID=A0A1I7WXF5_HETBA